MSQSDTTFCACTGPHTSLSPADPPIAAKIPPKGEGWLHEPKLDGYHLQVVKDGRQVQLYSRGGHDWTKCLARLAEALKAIPCRSAVIDGELVLPDMRGTPDFTGLAVALKKRQHELAVYAFDLLHRDGRDLRPLPLIERRPAVPHEAPQPFLTPIESARQTRRYPP